MISIALIHPMLVHFPIVLLITAVAMDIIVLLLKKDSLNLKPKFLGRWANGGRRR